MTRGPNVACWSASSSLNQIMETRVLVAGGGPAGLMTGLLLARAGVEVVVLEKHDDFLRDFRGDTIHPSTLDVMAELGYLDDLLALPHRKVHKLTGIVGNEHVEIADFTHLQTRCRFIALMPQWDFLDLLAEKARQHDHFSLLMRARATGVIVEGDRVTGLHVDTAAGPTDIYADLVVGADGRDSVIRQHAGLESETLGAPMDVLWLRVPRRDDDPSDVIGHIEGGHVFVMLDRGDSWQCALVIRKGGDDEIRAAGIEAFREKLLALSPWLLERVFAVRSFDDVKLLTVRVDRLTRWHRPGLICIGDAAHAMSPIAGVGINLAVQDAVALANIVGPRLRRGERVDDALLHEVQKRRERPTKWTQWMQDRIQRAVFEHVLSSSTAPPMPLVIRLLERSKLARRIPARLVGVGFRPEHVAT